MALTVCKLTAHRKALSMSLGLFITVGIQGCGEVNKVRFQSALISSSTDTPSSDNSSNNNDSVINISDIPMIIDPAPVDPNLDDGIIGGSVDQSTPNSDGSIHVDGTITLDDGSHQIVGDVTVNPNDGSIVGDITLDDGRIIDPIEIEVVYVFPRLPALDPSLPNQCLGQLANGPSDLCTVYNSQGQVVTKLKPVVKGFRFKKFRFRYHLGGYCDDVRWYNYRYTTAFMYRLVQCR